MTEHEKLTGSMPAFPVHDQGTHGCFGMTLRQHYLGVAVLAVATRRSRTLYLNGEDFGKMAREASELADELVKVASRG